MAEIPEIKERKHIGCGKCYQPYEYCTCPPAKVFSKDDFERVVIEYMRLVIKNYNGDGVRSDDHFEESKKIGKIIETFNKAPDDRKMELKYTLLKVMTNEPTLNDSTNCVLSSLAHDIDLSLTLK